MTFKDIALCSVFAVALPAGQTLFKLAAIESSRLGGLIVSRLMNNLPLWGAFAWYGLTAILWVYILSRVPLYKAYAFSMAGAGLVPLLAWLVFKEPVSWQAAFGFGIIMIGLLVVANAQAA
jgi:drug/metabolite transporter (DMT)-like permease